MVVAEQVKYYKDQRYLGVENVFALAEGVEFRRTRRLVSGCDDAANRGCRHP
jgi:hypothetical protein